MRQKLFLIALAASTPIVQAQTLQEQLQGKAREALQAGRSVSVQQPRFQIGDGKLFYDLGAVVTFRPDQPATQRPTDAPLDAQLRIELLRKYCPENILSFWNGYLTKAEEL